MPDSLIAIVMAAGKSTRFKSQHSKLLHAVLGQTIVQRVMRAVAGLSPQRIYVVVGHDGWEIQASLKAFRATFVTQEPQLGTGHCVRVATEHIQESSGIALILNGDIPLLTSELLAGLVAAHHKQKAALTLVFTRLDDPSGYGRIVKNSTGKVVRIVEDRDASPAQRRIREINVGLYVVSLPILKEFIPQLTNQNAQREYYLTELVALLSKAQKKVTVFCTTDAAQVLGVNDRVELANVEAILRERKLVDLMREGVTVIDPPSTSVDGDVAIGADTVLYPGVRIEGTSKIGKRCVIRSHSRITNSVLEDDVTVNDMSVVNESHVAPHATIGPFAHLRINAEIGSGVRVGNFVELKKTTLGRGAKASHLTYLGDTLVGEDTNIGAGTITCNYDGVSKNTTVIEDGCFIGSGVELVAPVAVRQGAYVAAGSVITEEVPAHALAIARGRQENKLNWKQKRGKQKEKSS